MTLDFHPSQALGFYRPFTDLSRKCTLTLTNHNDEPVAFKIRTTSRLKYIVRPMMGIVEPGASVDVLVVQRAMAKEPHPFEKCGDKFMVQSVILGPGTEASSFDALQFWDGISHGELVNLHFKELSVEYLSVSEGGLVDLNPSRCIEFFGTPNQILNTILTLSNPSSRPVVFKVKTTNNKVFCVRPTFGRIEPGESCTVVLKRQRLDQEPPPLSTSPKDRLLILSTIVTPDNEGMLPERIWKVCDGLETYGQKLKVLYPHYAKMHYPIRPRDDDEITLVEG